MNSWGPKFDEEPSWNLIKLLEVGCSHIITGQLMESLEQHFTTKNYFTTSISLSIREAFWWAESLLLTSRFAARAQAKNIYQQSSSLYGDKEREGSGYFSRTQNLIKGLRNRRWLNKALHYSGHLIVKRLKCQYWRWNSPQNLRQFFLNAPLKINATSN